MGPTRVILICDNDYSTMNLLQTALEKEGYDVNTIDNAMELIPTTIRLKPSIVMVNPDMNGFNEYDVCKNIMKDMNIPVFLVLDKHATTRAQVGECPADEVITRPIEKEVEIRNLLNLIAQQITVHYQ